MMMILKLLPNDVSLALRFMICIPAVCILSCNTIDDARRYCTPETLFHGRQICLGQSLSELQEEYDIGKSYEDDRYSEVITNPYFDALYYETEWGRVKSVLAAHHSLKLHWEDIDSLLSVCRRVYGDSVKVQVFKYEQAVDSLWIWKFDTNAYAWVHASMMYNQPDAYKVMFLLDWENNKEWDSLMIWRGREE